MHWLFFLYWQREIATVLEDKRMGVAHDGQACQKHVYHFPLYLLIDIVGIEDMKKKHDL